MRHLLFASRNRHKTIELSQLLGSAFELRDLSSVAHAPVIAESGRTFHENAALKAVGVSAVCDGLVVADDSGLEVDALNGAPGIFSARYAGEGATDSANVARLLAELHGVIPELRSARFRCVLALAREGELIATYEGWVEGRITRGPRGDNGFGYDPVFVPRAFTETFAELAAAKKNAVSHRALAVGALKSALLTGTVRPD